MATIRPTLQGSQLGPGSMSLIEQLEVRTAAVTLVVREIEDGGLVLTAVPAADGPELVVEVSDQGHTWRARIRGRSGS